MIQVVVVVVVVGFAVSRTSAPSEVDAVRAEVGDRQRVTPSSSESFFVGVLSFRRDIAFRRSVHLVKTWPGSQQ
jgi:hypothetical protein